MQAKQLNVANAIEEGFRNVNILMEHFFAIFLVAYLFVKYISLQFGVLGEIVIGGFVYAPLAGSIFMDLSTVG